MDRLADSLLHFARATPRADALACDDLQLSYAALAACVDATAERMRQHGVTPAAVVAIDGQHEPTHLIAVLALIRLGCTQYTASPTAGPAGDALAAVMQPTHQFGDDDLARLVRLDVPAEPRISTDPVVCADARLCFSTSGTTGTPKIVELDETDITAQAPRHVDQPSQRFACIAHIRHNFAKRHRLYCVAQGATNVFLNPDPEHLVDQCQQHGVSVLHVSGYQARELLAAPGVERLRGIQLKLGGSHVALPLREQLRATITDALHAGYGTTETGAIAFAGPDDHDASENVGRPLPGITVRIVDAQRQPVADGQDGEVAVHCAGLFRGYRGRDDLTQQHCQDGWFYTGDAGRIDANGRLCLSGRRDDMFVFNSLNIYPQALEARLCQAPGVADAVVVPRPSPVHGDIPVALVVAQPDATIDLRALRDDMRTHAGLRCPRQFLLVDAVPRNATGKILRDAARQLLAERVAATDA